MGDETEDQINNLITSERNTSTNEITNNLFNNIYDETDNLSNTITYKKESSTFPVNSTEIDHLNQLIGEKDIPYPDSNEIPEIKIKNENFFMNGEKIGDYLMNLDELKNYDDTKYNKCKNCKNKNDNGFFCVKCKKNLCGDCSYKCDKFNHELIDLKKMQNDLITQRNGIVDIMKKRFKDIEDPKAEKTPNIQKLNNSSIKENKIEIKKSIDTHKRLNDISLIARITKKLYINYFHIKNVFHCYGYVVNRYSETFNKRCIQIIYSKL